MPDPYKGFDLGEEPQSAPGGRNHLLVIAIDEYAHCPKLYNCVKDAREFIEVLAEKYRFEPENVTTLFNAEATRPNIHTQLKKLKSKVGPEDNLVIYFSGHGETEDNVGYWVPVNAHPGHEWEYFSTDEIKRRLDAIDSFHTFAIVDACFSGALFTTYKSVTPGYENKRSRWGLAASHSRERALDGTAGENSPFAATLLHQLRGSRDNLPVQDLAAAVIRQVEQATQGRQTPVFKPLNVRGDDSGQYVFRLKANEAADWKACREAGTLGAYRAFLAQYPEGAHARDARATLAKLEEEAAWAKAGETDTVAFYNAYLGRYPDGPHAEEAFQRIRQLEDETRWAEAGRIGQVYAYWDYLRRFPDGRHREEARARIRELEQPAYSAAEAPRPVKPPEKREAPPAPFPWRRNLLAGLGLAAVLLLGIWGVRQLTNSPTAESEARNQLKPFPFNGKYGYLDQSGKKIIAAIYDSAGLFQGGRALVARDGHTFTIDSTGACLAGCPEDKDKAAWAKAERLNDIDAYKNYQNAFPKGQFNEEADRRIKQLEEAQAWEDAKKRNTPDRYLNVYPNGKYASEAKKMKDAASKKAKAEAFPKKGSVTLRGKTYRTIQFKAGGPVWMAQNLDYEVPGSSWYHKYVQPSERGKYGLLYTWEAARQGCAALGGGWRLPEDEEWRDMIKQFGGADDDASDGGKVANKALIEGGSSGFSALLGGWRYTDGSFSDFGRDGCYWSATEHSFGNAWHYNFDRDGGKLYRFNDLDKACGFSCRCVRGAPPGGID